MIDKGPSDGDTLLVHARDLMRTSVALPLKLYHRQMTHHLFFDLLFRKLFYTKRKGDVLENGQVREERIALKDRVNVAPVRRHAIDALVAEQDLAFIGFDKACNKAQQSRLSAARRTKNREELARLNLQIYTIKNLLAIKAFFHSGDTNRTTFQCIASPDLLSLQADTGQSHFRGFACKENSRNDRGSMHNKNEPVIENRRNLSVPSRTLDPPIRLVDRAREIELADSSLRSHTEGKLDLILKQIRSLQEEARSILEKAERDAALHRVKCAFEKRIGQTIYLYEKEEGRYFSLLSPDDWNGSPPHTFIGAYSLNGDQSFTEVS